MPDSLIFDLDGTLWNTVALCVRAWNFTLTRDGISRRLTDADVMGTMGLTSREVEEKLFPELGTIQAAAIIDRCFEVEIEMLRAEGGIFYPGVETGLVSLAARYPIFLISNCEVAYLEAFAKVSSLFTLFTDSECHGRTRKSKGENIQAVVARNQLRSPVYIGDTASDEKACRVAGVKFGYAKYGFGTCERSDFCFGSFGEIVTTF